MGLSCRLLLLFFLGWISSCTQNPDVVDPLGGKTFWSYKIDLTGSGASMELLQVSAYLAGVSAHAKIYVEVDRGVTQSQVDQLLYEFETNIYPNLQQNLAEPLDVNEDGKVTFLLIDIQDSYTKQGDSYLGGYFDPFNMYRETSVILNAQRRSNEEDMLYMDIYPSVINSKNFLATMAHEYQHLLQFSYRYRQQLSQEYTWLDEGISEVSSDISGYGPQTSRLRYGDNSLSSGNSFFTWDSVVQDYSNAYLLLRYLADLYGNQFIFDLFKDPLIGIDSLQNVLKNQNDSALLNNCNTFSSNIEREEVYCALIRMWQSMLNIQDSDMHFFESGSNSFSLLSSTSKAFTTDITTLTDNITSRSSGSLYSNASSFSYLPGGYTVLNGVTRSFTGTNTNYTLLRSTSSGVSVLFNHNFNSAEPDFTNGTAALASLTYSSNFKAEAVRKTVQGHQKFIHLAIPPGIEQNLQIAAKPSSSSSLQLDAQ
jgi:hypothetical protein